MCFTLNYENVTKDMDNENKLFYAIICRRWDIVSEQINADCNWEEIKNRKFATTNITIEKCFSMNLQFLKSNKNKAYYQKICNNLGERFKNLIQEKKCDYDSKDFYEGESVFDVFFEGKQAVFDVKEFDKQMIASKQLMKNNATMVLDEVGTGKTVAGIYAMQKVIQYRLDENVKNLVFPSAAILIVCPYSKREDWNSDVNRQLGRRSVIIEQSDNGKLIKQKSQNPNKPLIYIMGCVGGNLDDSTSSLKKSLKTFHQNRNWDLVIIDECHNCYNNYCDIRADRVMLLTATPIVINSKNIRTFDDYKNLMKSIIGDSCWNPKIPVDKKIIPISKPLFDDNDIFVCNYKEDIFNVNINRKIKFILCERTENRKKWFNKLRYTKDFFSAMYADQDDFRLSEKMKDIFKDDLCDYNVGENKKLEKLIEIINGDGDYKEYITKSIIIFCEMQATVDMIYNKMVGLTDEKTIIGKKYGEVGEIQNITTNPNIVLERLKNHIRLANGNRSILITTGKSAGTGLNLGEFNTVIHYELPYTSNELEQRFGRIERADDLIRNISNNNEPVSIENEMIFLVNQASDEDSDFETNRMLYYAINKINIACQYMPMRNTVLFHPEFTKRLKGDAEKYFVRIQEICNNKNDIYNLDEYIKYKKRERTISEWIRELKNLTESEKNKIESAKDVKSKIDVILNDVDNNNDIIKKKDELDVFCKMESHDDVDKLVNTTLEFVLWLKNALKFYGIEFNSPDEFEDYEKIAETITEEKGNADTDNKTRNDAYKISISNIQDKIISEEILLDDICKKVLTAIKSINEGQNAMGIFYFDEDKKFCNKSVSDFRRNSKEKSV